MADSDDLNSEVIDLSESTDNAATLREQIEAWSNSEEGKENIVNLVAQTIKILNPAKAYDIFKLIKQKNNNQDIDIRLDSMKRALDKKNAKEIQKLKIEEKEKSTQINQPSNSAQREQLILERKNITERIKELKDLDKNEKDNFKRERDGLLEIIRKEPKYIIENEILQKIFGNTLDKEVKILTDAPENKVAMGEVFKGITLQDAVFAFPKSGGANNPGPDGGNYIVFYKEQNSDLIKPQIIFFKQANDVDPNNVKKTIANHRENIAEVLGGYIMNHLDSGINQNYTATTFLARSDNPAKHDLSSDQDSNLYVGSIFYSGYTDAHHAAYDAYNKDLPEDEKIETPKRKGAFTLANMRLGSNDQGKRLGGDTKFLQGFNTVVESGVNAEGLGRALSASLLVGNYQFHTENVGIAEFPGKKREFVMIDFGGAFRRDFTIRAGKTLKDAWRMYKNDKKAFFVHLKEYISDEVKEGKFPDSVSLSSLSKKQGANYFYAYPKEVRRSKDFIQGVDFATSIDEEKLKQVIENGINYITSQYQKETFLNSFASELDTTKNSFMKGYKPGVNDDEYIQKTTEFLQQTLTARLQSLKAMSLDVKAKNMLKADGSSRYTNSKIKEIVEKNPIYFAFKQNKKDYFKKNTSAKLSVQDALDANQQIELLTLQQSKYINSHELVKQIIEDRKFELTELTKKLENLTPKPDAILQQLKTTSNRMDDILAKLKDNNVDLSQALQAADSAYKIYRDNLNKTNLLLPNARNEILIANFARKIEPNHYDKLSKKEKKQLVAMHKALTEWSSTNLKGNPNLIKQLKSAAPKSLDITWRKKIANTFTEKKSFNMDEPFTHFVAATTTQERDNKIENIVGLAKSKVMQLVSTKQAGAADSLTTNQHNAFVKKFKFSYSPDTKKSNRLLNSLFQRKPDAVIIHAAQKIDNQEHVTQIYSSNKDVKKLSKYDFAQLAYVTLTDHLKEELRLNPDEIPHIIIRDNMHPELAKAYIAICRHHDIPCENEVLNVNFDAVNNKKDRVFQDKIFKFLADKDLAHNPLTIAMEQVAKNQAEPFEGHHVDLPPTLTN